LIVGTQLLDCIHSDTQSGARHNILKLQTVGTNIGEPLASREHGHPMAAVAQSRCIQRPDHPEAAHQDVRGASAAIRTLPTDATEDQRQASFDIGMPATL
jgi:hypothetical protein